MTAYSFKPRFIEPIRAGLGLPNFNSFGVDKNMVGQIQPKRQTIRAIGRRRHACPGDTLQLYTGMRTKQCRKIGDARCIGIEPITIVVGDMQWALSIRLDGKDIDGKDKVDFARADGFDDAGEMYDFWIKEHGSGEFRGVLIRWEKL